MDDCIFCKIVEGQIPAYKIYEDGDYLGFLDIFPRVAGHSLLIPKKHFTWVYDVPNFGEYWETVLKVTRAMQKSMAPTFVTYVTHGLEVPHAHIHIMPRTGEKEFVPERKKFEDAEMISIAEKIKSGF